MRPVLLLVLVSITIGCTSASSRDPIEFEREVVRLVEALGDTDYDRREEAQTLLLAIGPDVLPVIERIDPPGDPEAAHRLQLVRERLLFVPEAGPPIELTILFARSKYRDYQRATFSFEHGLRDDPRLAVTRNDWDLQYGNGGDVFTVSMVSDDRSRILDLGKKSWETLGELPDLPAYPEPKHDPEVDAIEGHMYLVHTVDSDTDLHAVFRVERLIRNDQCTITWMRVNTGD